MPDVKKLLRDNSELVFKKQYLDNYAKYGSNGFYTDVNCLKPQKNAHLLADLPIEEYLGVRNSDIRVISH